LREGLFPHKDLDTGMRILRREVSSISSNALYLMVATGITALFGFVFWIVIARTHKTSSVGVATILLSISTLISFIGLVGLDSGIIRFLSHEKDHSKHINSAMIVVGAATAILSLLFCLLLPVVSRKLLFVDRHPLDILYFVIITVFTAWNTFTSTVFIAYRRTSYILWVNAAVGVLKIALALVIRYGGAISIFNISGIAQIVNVIISLGILAHVFGYRPSMKLEFKVLSPSRRFSSTTYVANLFFLLPPTVLPIIVTNELGVTEAAFFYIAFTIATLLYAIPNSAMQSLYAEASHDPKSLRINVKKALLTSWGLLLPAVVLLMALIPLLLEAFGPAYKSGATALLRVFSLSSFLIALNLALVMIFRITLHFRAMILTNICYAVSFLGMVFIFIPAFGLVGVGVALAFGNLVAIAVGGIFVWRSGLTAPE